MSRCQTSDQSEAMALSDRIMVMRDGKMMQIDTPLNIYARPKNRFVFSFIGLLSFVDVDIDSSAAYVSGSRDAGAISSDVPPEFSGRNAATLACRPSEVNFVSDGQGVRGVVSRMSYLGENIDHAVRFGSYGQEIRVQKNRRDGRLSAGENCCVAFP